MPRKRCAQKGLPMIFDTLCLKSYFYKFFSSSILLIGYNMIFSSNFNTVRRQISGSETSNIRIKDLKHYFSGYR